MTHCGARKSMSATHSGRIPSPYLVHLRLEEPLPARSGWFRFLVVVVVESRPARSPAVAFTPSPAPTVGPARRQRAGPRTGARPPPAARPTRRAAPLVAGGRRPPPVAACWRCCPRTKGSRRRCPRRGRLHGLRLDAMDVVVSHASNRHLNLVHPNRTYEWRHARRRRGRPWRSDKGEAAGRADEEPRDDEGAVVSVPETIAPGGPAAYMREAGRQASVGEAEDVRRRGVLKDDNGKQRALRSACCRCGVGVCVSES